MVKTLLHHQKRLLSFQNDHLFVFNDTQSTQYHKKTHFSLMNETLNGHSNFNNQTDPLKDFGVMTLELAKIAKITVSAL